MFSPLQLGANALLFLSVNMYGVFVRLLAERSQRKAFLQARNCIEDRLRLEDENEKQVSAWGPAGGPRGDAGWGARGGTAFSHGPWVWGPTWPAWGRVGACRPLCLCGPPRIRSEMGAEVEEMPPPVILWP